LAAVKAKAEQRTAAARSATKLTKALIALETYVTGLADLIIDYASARLDDEPFFTSPTEGSVQWLLHRRMGAQQQMRWSPRGAHLMLQVRTAIVNGTFNEDHGTVSRCSDDYRRYALNQGGEPGSPVRRMRSKAPAVTSCRRSSH
jgi:hypothetical protein